MSPPQRDVKRFCGEHDALDRLCQVDEEHKAWKDVAERDQAVMLINDLGTEGKKKENEKMF